MSAKRLRMSSPISGLDDGVPLPAQPVFLRLLLRQRRESTRLSSTEAGSARSILFVVRSKARSIQTVVSFMCPGVLGTVTSKEVPPVSRHCFRSMH